MILIADSGATKTSWRILIDNDTIKQAQTIGYNPYHHNAEVLENEVRDNLLPNLGDKDVQHVFYYGAGCSEPENIRKVQQAINAVFPGAIVEVNHDMLAAARALCGKEKGIACILGTGANSCYFDGNKIAFKEPSLGFILGDEGSGAYLGKQLLIAFIRKELPRVILERLEARFELSKEVILQHVYQEDSPARYLSSFSKFIFQNIATPELYRLVYDALELFFKKNILKYPNCMEVPVHFTGSVAFYYGNILRQVSGDLGINVQNVIEDPIAGLTLYHQDLMKA